MNTNARCDGEYLCPEAYRLWQMHLHAYNLAIRTNEAHDWIDYDASGLAYKKHVHICNPEYFGEEREA